MATVKANTTPFLGRQCSRSPPQKKQWCQYVVAHYAGIIAHIVIDKLKGDD